MFPNFYGPLDILVAETSLCSTEAHSMNVRAPFFLFQLPFCLKVTSLWHSCQASHLVKYVLPFLPKGCCFPVSYRKSYIGDSGCKIEKKDRLINKREV